MCGLKYERAHGGPPLPPVLNHSGGICMRMDTSRMCQKIFFVHGCIHTVRVCSCLGGGCACAEALKWIHAGVHSAWQEESLLAKKSRLRGTHTVHVDTQLEAVGDGGATVFHETSEWATKHHTCQLLSSRRRPGNQT